MTNTLYIKSFLRVTIVTVALLLVPLVVMQFTDEVNWGVADFIIIGTLLLCAGLAYEFILKKIINVRYRFISVVLLFAVLLLIWAELAIGIFGTPFAGS